MGMLSVENIVLPRPGQNMTGVEDIPTFTRLPTNLLESLIPGYGPISQFLSELLGFDITVLVSISLLLLGVFTSSKYIWRYVTEGFQKWLMAKITVTSDDDIFDHIMEWLANQGLVRESRSLKAATQCRRTWDAITGDIEEVQAEVDGDVVQPDQWLNYCDSDAKVPPRFEPDLGDHWFRHDGRFYFLTRDSKQSLGSGFGGPLINDKEFVSLSCFGRSTQPIKDLLKAATQYHMEKENSMTRIRRPAPKEERSSRWSPWQRVATRPSRPLRTVVLDYEQKKSLLKDVNEYLHPDTPRWYSNRGIPYRRGYLFHGPPGTGKTSLSFALAGCFGLDVYVISLLDPTLSEEDLMLLFNKLQRRCVVLLEDIDASGITHKREDATEEDLKGKTGKDWSLVDVAKAMKASKAEDEKDKKKGISLSGLLNAIDGVASHEGRVLVMTTNHPEKLDDALIRPGRVDLQVGFSLATQPQIYELFVGMYTSERPKAIVPNLIKSIEDLIGVEENISDWSKEGDSVEHNKDQSGLPSSNGHVRHNGRRVNALQPCTLSLSEIRSVARKFANLLPDCKFSPAEVQGFLLLRKTDPYKALEEVEKWRDSLLESKASHTKVLTVQ